MTTKTDEQLRDAFEAWAKTHYYLSELGLDFEDDEYVDMEVQGAFEAYQAGRAALQSQAPDTVDALSYLKGLEAGQRVALRSQDREDAEEIAATLATVLHFIPKQEEPELYDDVERLCSAFIDHARRIEGEG